MNKFDLLFLSINPFISKVKQLNADDNQIKNNESNDLKESDYIDINEEYKQKNTITSFYNIYNEEKKIYNSKNISSESETQNLNKVRLLVDSECEILRKTIFRFFKGIFFYIFLVRVLNVASDFFAPLLLGKLLGITTKTERNLYSSEKMECYAYIVLFIASCLTRIFTSMIFNYNLNMIRNRIEIIVNDLIYKKILVLGKNSKNSEAKITKFLNDDISTFFCFFINLNRSWELPIEIILAIYGTYKHVSLAFLPGLLFAIVLLYVNYHIAISITKTNKDLYKVRLDRQELEILALKNVKSIKFEFLEKFFLNKIFGFREIEFDLLTFKKYLDALCCYLWAASPVLISFFSIFSYILSGNLIDAEKVFTTISLLNMTIHPMNVFPWIFADMKDAKRVYMKFVKYLIKGKKLKLNLEKMNSKANFFQADEEEKLNKNNNNNNRINITDNCAENVLLNISNVKIKYNLNANSINSFYCKENNAESEKASKINESFDLVIEKPNELSIGRGELVVIYGNNASGKSLLLKAILDYCIDESEYAHDHKHSETLIIPLFSNDSTYEGKGKTGSGSDKDLLKNTNRVYVKNNNISYVPQELWTFSASLYENITFNSNQNKKANLSNDACNEPNEDAIAIKKRFEDIIKKCEMVRDIETFPEKELKIIDFKGSNISGGQKQRINIARAAFNKESDLLLFDNCLSSIDSNIANLIFANLFQYLKSEGKGIVFVTSDRNWLKNADKVYFIEKNQLVRKEKSELKGFYEISNSTSNYLDENSITEENKNPEIIIEQTLNNVGTDDLENQEDQEIISRKTIEIKASSNDENASSNNNNTNVSISYKTLIFFFSKAGYTLFTTTIVFLTFMQLGRNFIELFLADWLKNDKADLDRKKDLQRTNMKYYLLFVVLHTIATIGRSAFFAINFLNAAEKIYKMTIEKFIFSKIKCLQRFNIAYLTNLMQNEILTVDESLPFEFNRLLAYTIGLIGSFIVIGYSTFSVYFVVLFIAGAYYYKNLYNDYTITSKFLEEKRNQINQPLTNLFLDTLEGKKIINCFHKQSYFNEKLNSLIEKKIKMTHTEQSLGFWLSLRLDILSFCIYSIVMVLIGICVYQDKYEVITFLSLAMTTALNITSPLSSFLPWLGVTEDRFRAVERIRKTLDCLEDEREKNIEESAEDDKTESNNNLNSAIEFKNVHLKYDSKGEDILKNISFEISKGQKIAIIGRTGAGKSTIFSAITKQEEISAGSIHINSKNIKSLNHNSIRESIAFISKDVFLIEGSIKDNLDFQNKFDASEIEEFLSQFEKLFENKEFEIFNKINFKLNSIEKNGANLSEGQKNLLNILRALLKKKPIICFDESNSELDNVTEKIIFDLIFEKYGHITFIIITHKLQILNKFDYVYLIDEGRISKQGVPADIINDSSLKGYNFE